MEKFITASGCALRVTDTCKGVPVIVLLHGYLETLEVWDDFAKLLAPSCRIITMDLPGHGISEVKGEVHTMEFLSDVVADALTVLGVDKCFIVGHSMGGYAALEFMDKYPEKLSGLILMNSHPYPDSETVSGNRAREIEMVLSQKKDLIAQLSIGVRFAPENRKKFRAKIDELIDLASVCDDDGTAALIRGMASRRDTTGVLQKSDIPQLFILGAADEYITPEIVGNMRSSVPKATVELVENSGHMSFIEQPQVAADAILRFTGVKQDAL